MNTGPAAEAGGHRCEEKTPALPPTIVKIATLAIIPWMIGSLYSPMGVPHVALLALPPLTLAVLLVAARHCHRPRRLHHLWLLTGALAFASILRFLVVPIYGLLATGGGDEAIEIEAADAVWRQVGFVVQVPHAIFYLGSAGLLAAGLLLLARRWILGRGDHSS